MICHNTEGPPDRPTGCDQSQQTVLLGTLSIVPARRPWLRLVVRCPFCRRDHVHTWGIDVEPDTPTHRAPHCTRSSSPYRLGGYYVGPAPTPENQRVLEQYAGAGPPRGW
jgi:hypothetical protein